MPSGSDQNGAPLTREERKQLLILACAADRAAWRHACRPVTSEPTELVGRVLDLIEPFLSLLPGRIGRWLRGANFLAGIGRQFGWLRS